MSKKSFNKVTMVQYIYVFIFALLNVTFSSLIANAMPMANRNVPNTKGNHQEELPEVYPNPAPQQKDIEQVVSRMLLISFNTGRKNETQYSYITSYIILSLCFYHLEEISTSSNY